ncbi:MAG TPA: hypothetical protein VM260_00500, partial [Pirellula sp.]|nr:hypothetical protein [Pirellula sp.]
FALGSLAIGDYEVQLSGVSTPNGPRDQLRVTGASTYFFRQDPNWIVMDATVVGGDVASPSEPNTCRVRLISTRGATGVQVRVVIVSGSTGRESERAFLNAAYDGETDEDGQLLVDLPWSSNAGVGKYRFRLIDLVTGKTLHDRTCTVPDEENADNEELV